MFVFLCLFEESERLSLLVYMLQHILFLCQNALEFQPHCARMSRLARESDGAPASTHLASSVSTRCVTATIALWWQIGFIGTETTCTILE